MKKQLKSIIYFNKVTNLTTMKKLFFTISIRIHSHNNYFWPDIFFSLKWYIFTLRAVCNTFWLGTIKTWSSLLVYLKFVSFIKWITTFWSEFTNYVENMLRGGAYIRNWLTKLNNVINIFTWIFHIVFKK